MLSSKKIVAFDLDGTLTESKQPLTAPVAEALVDLAREKKVVIISGGSIDQYKKQFLPCFGEVAAKKAANFDNLILMPISGTERYQFDQSKQEWALFDREPFPEAIKEKVRTLLSEMVASGKYGIPAESFGDRVEDRGSQITLSALGQQAPVDRKKVWDPDQKKRQLMKAEFELKIPDASVGIGGMTSLDILPKGFTKAVGLKRLLDSLGYAPSDLLYVGDALFPGGNDYSVIEAHIDAVLVGGPEDTVSDIKKWLAGKGVSGSGENKTNAV